MKELSDSDEKRSILSEKKFKGRLSKKSMGRRYLSKSICEKSSGNQERTDRKTKRQINLKISRGFKKNDVRFEDNSDRTAQNQEKYVEPCA